MKSFLKSHKGVTVLLQLHTSTAVAYINNLGGTVSPVLASMARSLWLWALERDIMLSAQHIYSRGAEYNSRPQVQSGEGQVGLDAVSSSVSRIHPNPGPPVGRSVRLAIDSPTTTVLQLDTGPTGGSSRCISARLEPVEGVYQSSMVPSRMHVEQVEVTRCSTGPSGSSVEGPVLVSHSSENAEGFSPAPLSTAGQNAEGGTAENR